MRSRTHITRARRNWVTAKVTNTLTITKEITSPRILLPRSGNTTSRATRGTKSRSGNGWRNGDGPPEANTMKVLEGDSDQLKRTLRIRMQARLTSLEAEQGARFTVRIFERMIRLPAFEKAETVLSYVSMAREVGTHNLIRHCLLAGKKVCVPAFDRERKRYFVVAIEDFDRDLGLGYHGILEPRDAEPTATQADLAIVPGLAFDNRGNRLGRGKGYFDAL